MPSFNPSAPLPETIQVRCEFTDTKPPCRVRNFVNGRVYTAYRVRADLRVYNVTDERGHTRVVLPGEPCPHLPPSFEPFRSEHLGRFVQVAS